MSVSTPHARLTWWLRRSGPKFAVAARPEIVSLAGGSPYVAALPLDVVGEMIGQLIASQGATALQYCTAQGDAGLRERICDVMALEQIRAHPDEVVVTVGSQQALDLLARIFVDPGDVVLLRRPPTWAPWAPSRPTRPTWCTWRWTTTG